jgi:hypothetical protein
MIALTYNPDKDYYKVLGVGDGANSEDIKLAYRELARTLHPDVTKDADLIERYKIVVEAHEVLSDPDARQQYDLLRGEYLLGLPPILRLSFVEVDFGTAEPGENTEKVVQICNDGGDGVCVLEAESGRFWRANGAAPDEDDPDDVIGRLIFILELKDTETAGVLEDEIAVSLVNDSGASSCQVKLRVATYSRPTPAYQVDEDPWPTTFTPSGHGLVNLHPSTWIIFFNEKLLGWTSIAAFAAFWIGGSFEWPWPLRFSQHVVGAVELVASPPGWFWIVLVALLTIGMIVLAIKAPAAGKAVGEAASAAVMVLSKLGFIYTKLTIYAIWLMIRWSRETYRKTRHP